MSDRAARRRAIKAVRKGRPVPVEPSERRIQLENPVANHYETWIVGNSVIWQIRAMVEAQGVLGPEAYGALVDEFASHRPSAAFAESPFFHDAILPFAASRYVVEEHSATGQTLVLCGAGPSLAETAAEWCPKGDQIWGCNSALQYLEAHGHRPTHGFTIDQTPQMVAEWSTLPDVEYLLATTIHPHLSDAIVAANRRFRFFHNFVGIRKPPVRWADADGVEQTLPYEEWLYHLLFPPTVMAGAGLNAVTRALHVAEFMGFAKIIVLGADCAMRVKGEPRQDFVLGSPEHLAWLRESTVMHADGGHALAADASPLTMSATIDGRYWLTKADLAITAQWLVRMAKASNGRIALVGDTLPVALLDKDDAFWAQMPNFVCADGKLANIPLMAQVPADATQAAHVAGGVQ